MLRTISREAKESEGPKLEEDVLQTSRMKLKNEEKLQKSSGFSNLYLVFMYVEVKFWVLFLLQLILLNGGSVTTC